MKEIKIKEINKKDLLECTCGEAKVVLDRHSPLALIMGMTGPGTLKVEFVPKLQYPQLPNCEDWMQYWTRKTVDITETLNALPPEVRTVCGYSAAAWWYKEARMYFKDSTKYSEYIAIANQWLNIANQWLKWAEGKEWR